MDQNQVGAPEKAECSRAARNGKQWRREHRREAGARDRVAGIEQWREQQSGNRVDQNQVGAPGKAECSRAARNGKQWRREHRTEGKVSFRCELDVKSGR